MAAGQKSVSELPREVAYRFDSNTVQLPEQIFPRQTTSDEDSVQSPCHNSPAGAWLKANASDHHRDHTTLNTVQDKKKGLKIMIFLFVIYCEHDSVQTAHTEI